MNEEILAGIKTALAHGFSLDEAVNSFINAGNNPPEVKEAASYISRGISPLPSASKEAEARVQAVQKDSAAEKKPETSKRLKLILLILTALVVLLIILSFLLFKDQFLAFIDKIFP